jgi:ubiquinone/menaquinone biosynthesis C-methylase UbiE
MNRFHRWCCASKRWARTVQEFMMPGVIGDAQLGDDVLEIGPGPGLTTDWLRTRVPNLTAVEIDQRLAVSLQERLAGTNVTVVHGDATRMPFPDGSFTSAVCFTMLHHVPSKALQDDLLRHTCRVLQSGAVFIGSDSIPTFVWNLAHMFDTRVPVDPESFSGRLETAGFTDVEVRRGRGPYFSWSARKP